VPFTLASAGIGAAGLLFTRIVVTGPAGSVVVARTRTSTVTNGVKAVAAGIIVARDTALAVSCAAVTFVHAVAVDNLNW